MVMQPEYWYFQEFGTGKVTAVEMTEEEKGLEAVKKAELIWANQQFLDSTNAIKRAQQKALKSIW